MMTSSSLVSNPRESWIRRIKKKKGQTFNDQIQNQWKSEAQQQVYSSKLVQALLRQVRLTGSGSGSGSRGRGKVVRETADRVLATAAKGRSRWSRAILKNRLKLKMKFMKNKRQRQRQRGVGMVTTTLLSAKNNRLRKPRLSILRLKLKNLPAVQRKVRVLGRLVPGCCKEELPVILEETIDYISALQMQIRAMNNLLSTATASATSSTSSLI